MTLMALLAAIAAPSLVRCWLYLRSVERYGARVRDHAQLIEYALAIRPWRRPP